MSVKSVPKKGYKIVKGDFREDFSIPNEWKISPLQNLCLKIKSGGTPKSDEKLYYGGNIPFSSIVDITNSERYLKKTQKTISKLGLENSNAWIVPKNSLLYSMYATVGKPIINKIDTSTHQGILGILINTKKIDNDFLFYVLQNIRRKLPRYFLTNTQSNINLEISKNLKILHPQNIKEQQKIATILSNIDNLIESTGKVIENSKRVKTGLMQKLLTRGIGHTKFKKVKLYFGKEIEIPEEWKMTPLKDLTKKIVKGIFDISPKNYVSSGVTFLRISDIEKNEIKSTTKFLNSEISEKFEYSVMKQGDIVLAKVGASAGSVEKIAIIPQEIGICNISQNLIGIKVKNSLCIPEFLIMILSQKKFMNTIISKSNTTTFKSVQLSVLRNSMILTPCLNEQQKIASILSNTDEKIQSYKRYRQKLQNLKTSLMQKLLTGEVRV